MRYFLAIAATLTAAAPALAAERTSDAALMQTGRWVANYGDASCDLSAQFGEGAQGIAVRFTRQQPGDTFDLTFVGDPLRSKDIEAKGKLTFGTAKPHDVTGFLGTLGGKPMVMVIAQRFYQIEGDRSKAEGAPTITPQQEAQVGRLTLEIFKRRFDFTLGSMAAPMAAMRTCTDDLQRSWGYDPAVVASFSRRAEPSNYPGDWATTSDFPLESLKKGHNGIVHFRLDLDEAGKILGCHVIAQTKPEDFGDLTCKLVVRRAQFRPALDASGKPAKSYYISRVRYWQPSD